MKEEMRQDLERFGKVMSDEATWVHPWVEYWRLNCATHRDMLIKALSAKYPDYTFFKGETHVLPHIYPVIVIYRKGDKL